MNTKHCLITILCSIALVACFAGAGPDAHAQGISVSTYELTDLGTFSDQKVAVSTATAINATGEVTGIAGKFAFCYDSSRCRYCLGRGAHHLAQMVEVDKRQLISSSWVPVYFSSLSKQDP